MAEVVESSKSAKKMTAAMIRDGSLEKFVWYSMHEKSEVLPKAKVKAEPRGPRRCKEQHGQVDNLLIFSSSNEESKQQLSRRMRNIPHKSQEQVAITNKPLAVPDRRCC